MWINVSICNILWVSQTDDDSSCLKFHRSGTQSSNSALVFSYHIICVCFGNSYILWQGSACLQLFRQLYFWLAILLVNWLCLQYRFCPPLACTTNKSNQSRSSACPLVLTFDPAGVWRKIYDLHVFVLIRRPR